MQLKIQYGFTRVYVVYLQMKHYRCSPRQLQGDSGTTYSLRPGVTEGVPEGQPEFETEARAERFRVRLPSKSDCRNG